MARKGLIKAIAYLRTSSQTNVGQDKDSEKRQTEAIANFARFAGYEIVARYYNPGVSGADPIEIRPGFIAMLDHTRTVVNILCVMKGTQRRKNRRSWVSLMGSSAPQGTNRFLMGAGRVLDAFGELSRTGGKTDPEPFSNLNVV